ncbi:MAG: 6,7-dimethyl-8-ribityllumazine synthase [Verrucomicrobiales bacterium]|jgi:6,7-dimethyl-8-ribityllumazine synthase
MAGSSSSSSLRRRPRLIGPRKTVAIIASTYHENYVAGMIEHARDELLASMPNASVPLYRVPGAFEIPVCASYVTTHTNVDVLIALGVIIRGETEHADLVANSVFRGLQDIAIHQHVPVINEVLLLDDEEQAEERCLGEDTNRGREAGQAAVAMAELFIKLRETYPDVVTKTG